MNRGLFFACNRLSVYETLDGIKSLINRDRRFIKIDRKGDRALVERRKHARYKVKDGIVAVPHASSTRFGKVREISMGGLTVRYFEEKEWGCEPSEIDLVLSDADFSLDRVPIKIMFDMEKHISTPYRILHERRCGLQFGKLTELQAAQLSNYLRNYAVLPD